MGPQEDRGFSTVLREKVHHFNASSSSARRSQRILQKPERTALRVLSTLLEEGLLVSDAPSAPVLLGFPATLMGYYFPRLYPESVELDAGHMS